MDAPMNLTYDQKRDVLYLYYGEPRPAISEEIEPGCLIRRGLRDRRSRGGDCNRVRKKGAVATA